MELKRSWEKFEFLRESCADKSFPEKIARTPSQSTPENQAQVYDQRPVPPTNFSIFVKDLIPHTETIHSKINHSHRSNHSFLQKLGRVFVAQRYCADAEKSYFTVYFDCYSLISIVLVFFLRLICITSMFCSVVRHVNVFIEKLPAC